MNKRKEAARMRHFQTAATLNPSPALLAKLASALVHAEEYLDAAGRGHPFDKNAFDALLADPDIISWMAGMRDLEMLPVKR